jgi:hypothetical protein
MILPDLTTMRLRMVLTASGGSATIAVGPSQFETGPTSLNCMLLCISWMQLTYLWAMDLLMHVMEEELLILIYCFGR